MIYLNLPQVSYYKTTSVVHDFEPIVNYLYLAAANYASGKTIFF